MCTVIEIRIKKNKYFKFQKYSQLISTLLIQKQEKVSDVRHNNS